MFLGFLFYKMRCLIKKRISKYLTASVNGLGTIAGDVEVEHPERICIGKNSFVNGGQLFAGEKSRIIIGENCMVSYNVHIRTTYHNYKDRKTTMIQQGMNEMDIIIEDNVWIGHSAHIMPGCTIHSGAVVGANAVVTHDVPANTVVAGVPAKIISVL